jgi:hypothetical protein
VTIELTALLRTSMTLTDVLVYAESLISDVPHSPLVLVETMVSPREVVIGPFPTAQPLAKPRVEGLPDCRKPFTMWGLGYLHLACERVAKVGLALGHLLSDEERGRSTNGQTEHERLERAELAGYRAVIDTGVFRTRPSFFLSALLACSIATLSRSRILDDSNHLKFGTLVDPSLLVALFARYRHARSFEQLSDRFCAEIGFGASWPDALSED